jgi:hypothetical protein
VLSVKMTIAGNAIEISGVPVGEAHTLIAYWLSAMGHGDQARIDALTARLAAANTTLRRSVDAATSS